MRSIVSPQPAVSACAVDDERTRRQNTGTAAFAVDPAA